MDACLIYCRISDDRTGAGAGVERQREDTLALAEQRGWHVLEVIEDNDLSASTGVLRPGFERALEMIETGAVRVLVAWTWERLERTRKDSLRLIEACQRHGVMVALVRGSDMDLATPAGRLVADMLSSMARNEIEVKADRAKRAREQRLARGQRAGGARPFGYTSGMVPIDHEADAIREAYRRVLAGDSLGSITRWLNDSELFTVRGGPWRPGNLGQALRRGCYAGILEHRGQDRGDAAWTPLIDRVLWERAQSVLRAPERRTHTTNASALLTGIARCGICDAPIRGGGATSSAGTAAYRCSATPHLHRQRQPVDDYVRESVASAIRMMDAIDAGGVEIFGVKLAGRAMVAGSAPAALVQELRELEHRLDALADDLKLSERVLTRRAQVIEDRIGAIRRQIAAETGERPEASELADLLELGEHPDYATAFLAADIPAQRRVIRWALAEIIVRPLGRGSGWRQPIERTVHLFGHREH
ncbi:MAG: recombinase family protein [Sporichthyaceae bacterium]